MPNILISNVGFGDSSPASLLELKKHSNVFENEDRSRFTEDDFLKSISNADILIAGTEKITQTVLEKAPNLKLISRVGVGVDSIDLAYAMERGISISYTPEAPSSSVPEFTLALILNLIKGISISDRGMHKEEWCRPMGRMLSSSTIGIVGAGKIGSKIIKLLKTLSLNLDIFFYDPFVEKIPGASRCDLETLFQNSDIISIHLPLTTDTQDMINTDLLEQMKNNAYLINTARGGIIDEQALYDALFTNRIAGAAIDVFESEPYNGPLMTLDNCLLTSHIGSMTKEVRALMEAQVVEDIERFLNKKSLLRPLKDFDFTGKEI